MRPAEAPRLILSTLDTSATLRPEDVERAAGPVRVTLDPLRERQVVAGAAYLAAAVAAGERVHGSPPEFEVGQSELPPAVTRGMLLCRLWTLAKGRSGVRVAVLHHLCRFLATPLAPVSPAVAALSGRGEMWVGRDRMPAARALARFGLEPLRPAERDMLALVSGNPLPAAAAALAVAKAKRSLRAAQELGAAPGFDPRSTLDYIEAAITAELNGIGDDPVIFRELNKIAHGGNLGSQAVGFAADLLSIVLSQLGNLAERQLDLLRHNGARSMVVAMRREAAPVSTQSLPADHLQAALVALRQAERLRRLHGMLAVALSRPGHRIPPAMLLSPQGRGADSTVPPGR